MFLHHSCLCRFLKYGAPNTHLVNFTSLVTATVSLTQCQDSSFTVVTSPTATVWSGFIYFFLQPFSSWSNALPSIFTFVTWQHLACQMVRPLILHMKKVNDDSYGHRINTERSTLWLLFFKLNTTNMAAVGKSPLKQIVTPVEHGTRNTYLLTYLTTYLLTFLLTYFTYLLQGAESFLRC